jgi:glyoxylase-like metal-dependent hydrolase (beta-lactamase superfamily II)
MGIEQVAEGVYRLGSRWVNFYLVEEAGEVTVIDAGMPAYFDQVPAALGEMGRSPNDVKAIVLTHTHSDHVGCVPALMEMSGAPVLVAAGEAAIATGDQKPAAPKGIVSSIWRPAMLKFVGHAIANKGMSSVKIPQVSPFTDGDELDVPGKVRVIATPGHSSAHAALLLEDRRVLFCGDAMATLAVDTGATGPMLHPFNEDPDQAVRSLDILEKIVADLLLPGHGAPWRGSVADAVSEARRRL